MADDVRRTAAPVRFNPMDPAFMQDPHDVYARLRREAPYLLTMGTRILTRYADVQAALKDRRLSVALIPDTIVRSARKQGVGDVAQIERFIRNSIVFTDAPEHTRLRRLINQAYTPATIRELHGLIDDEVGACLEAFDAQGHDDLVAHVAQPLPVNALCAWMGVDPRARTGIAGHIHVIRYLLDPGLMTPAHFASVGGSLATLTDFFIAHARAVRHDGRRNLVSMLCEAESGGDRLAEEEVAFACIMSFVAGTETTQCLIGNLLIALARHPEQMQALRADAALLPVAVDEATRYETPLQLTKRVVPEPVEINGQPVARGEQLLLCMGAANRDETVFERPDRYDLARKGPGHVGFGVGMHSCLGGLLARVQAERCLGAMLARYRDIDLGEATVQWQTDSLILRGPRRLPLRVHPAGPGQARRAA
ncbi:cytochrome P450 [Bordetella genomosp. 13]|uniref:cytochrome P450 n=1 Tax=Bordetella genomosp. 13 TaxID=463040 RepID=UPI00119EBBA3|nr:cytochrome P450 [Bordetella genomosp. 13]